jgi:hypothetical protein
MGQVLKTKKFFPSLLLGPFSSIFTKVIVSIPAFDLFPHPRITPFCIFTLTYSCTSLELFPRGQSMQVHDLAKNEWILFTARKWMQSTHGNSDLQ